MTEWMWNITNEAGIGHPSLIAWIIKKVDGGVFTFERNPYYFKVDAEGNQLPYIDGIRSEVVQDKETLTTRALMGEFDYLGERASLKKLPLMKEKEASGAIKVLIPKMHRLPINFNLNLTVTDPTWRAVTGDVRFRRALSLAINRPEILKNFYLNQFAKLPSRSSNAEYSVDKANALLDEMGMKKAATGSGRSRWQALQHPLRGGRRLGGPRADVRADCRVLEEGGRQYDRQEGDGTLRQPLDCQRAPGYRHLGARDDLAQRRLG